ncbi:MAG: hypothetical protein IPK86_00075 [Neisseriales bacterium]|nr:MAG: hypothetical protein IPK86_00075 [Neisseriales bacterium]
MILDANGNLEVGSKGFDLVISMIKDYPYVEGYITGKTEELPDKKPFWAKFLDVYPTLGVIPIIFIGLFIGLILINIFE